MKDVRVVVDQSEVKQLLNGTDYRRYLESVGFMILARAVPLTGIDTGQLRASMDTTVISGENGLELLGGSNVSRGGQSAVEYAEWHWAPGKPGGFRSGWKGTRPWSRALRALGITARSETGYRV